MLQKELAKRLKARYDTKMDGNEWMEVSSDGDSVFWGDYSPNYEYVKEAFAVRSGLVSKCRLFSENRIGSTYSSQKPPVFFSAVGQKVWLLCKVS